MNLDRWLAILGLILGLGGTAVGVYASQSDHSLGLLVASGWIASILIGLTICSLAFRAVTALEDAHKAADKNAQLQHQIALNELTSARKDAEARAQVLVREVEALRAEVSEFRNISRALTAVIAPEEMPKSSSRRGKRPKPAAQQGGAAAAQQGGAAQNNMAVGAAGAQGVEDE